MNKLRSIWVGVAAFVIGSALVAYAAVPINKIGDGLTLSSAKSLSVTVPMALAYTNSAVATPGFSLNSTGDQSVMELRTGGTMRGRFRSDVNGQSHFIGSTNLVLRVNGDTVIGTCGSPDPCIDALVADQTGRVLIGRMTDATSGAMGAGTLQVMSASQGQFGFGRSAAHASTTLGAIRGFNGTTEVVQLAVLGGGATDSGDFYVFTRPTGGSLTQRIMVASNGRINLGGRLQRGTATVASANNLALGEANVNALTGTTTVNCVSSSGWTSGSVVWLTFSTSLTVTNNSGTCSGSDDPLFLAGAANFSATADDVLTLLWDGTNWRETARSVN